MAGRRGVDRQVGADVHRGHRRAARHRRRGQLLPAPRRLRRQQQQVPRGSRAATGLPVRPGHPRRSGARTSSGRCGSSRPARPQSATGTCCWSSTGSTKTSEPGHTAAWPACCPTIAGGHAHVHVTSRLYPELPNDVTAIAGHPLPATKPDELTGFPGFEHQAALARDRADRRPRSPLRGSRVQHPRPAHRRRRAADQQRPGHPHRRPHARLTRPPAEHRRPDQRRRGPRPRRAADRLPGPTPLPVRPRIPTRTSTSPPQPQRRLLPPTTARLVRHLATPRLAPHPRPPHQHPPLPTRHLPHHPGRRPGPPAPTWSATSAGSTPPSAPSAWTEPSRPCAKPTCPRSLPYAT